MSAARRYLIYYDHAVIGQKVPQIKGSNKFTLENPVLSSITVKDADHSFLPFHVEKSYCEMDIEWEGGKLHVGPSQRSSAQIIRLNEKEITFNHYDQVNNCRALDQVNYTRLKLSEEYGDVTVSFPEGTDSKGDCTIEHTNKQLRWTSILNISLSVTGKARISEVAMIRSELRDPIEGNVIVVKSNQEDTTRSKCSTLSHGGGDSPSSQVHRDLGHLKFSGTAFHPIHDFEMPSHLINMISLRGNGSDPAVLCMRTVAPYYIRPCKINVSYDNYLTQLNNTKTYQCAQTMIIPIANSPSVRYNSRATRSSDRLSDESKIRIKDTFEIQVITVNHDNTPIFATYELPDGSELVNSTPEPLDSPDSPQLLTWRVEPDRSATISIEYIRSDLFC